MAGVDWTRTITRRETSVQVPDSVRSAAEPLLDWENWLTFGLALLATITVSLTLEASGWTRHMPAITLVAVLALPVAMFLARSRISMFLAWPLAIGLGALVTFWQTMEMVGPGTFSERLDAVHFRFEQWFGLAFGSGISGDPLPFSVLIVGLTWLGVFLFGWAVFRWHNAWIGLIPGGVALFLVTTFIDDAARSSMIYYVLLGFLLIMRTNLTVRIDRWRREGTTYPPLISLTFLNFATWAILGLIAVAWAAPIGPYSTPAPVKAAISGLEGVGAQFVRLAGPLHSSKSVVPAHGYSGLLPFQGSINLGDRELMTVELAGAELEGQLLLRGAVYDAYSSGGWTTGDRTDALLAGDTEAYLRTGIANERIDGHLVPITVSMETRSVVGSVIFSPGFPVSSDRPLRAQITQGSLTERYYGMALPSDTARPFGFENPLVGVSLNTRADGSVVARAFDTRHQPVPDALVLVPSSRVGDGESYRVTGFIPIVTPEQLRRAGTDYPYWVQAQYMEYPEMVPERVADLALQVSAGATNPYDTAKAIEAYVRAYPVDYAIGNIPPDRDVVDYFLFDARRGYFDYHASAMVVMLRAAGVPSRLGVGFVVDDGDRDETGSYTVRDRNAYAWTEVYFPGHGWVPFNPSPDRSSELMPGVRESGTLLPSAPTLEDFRDHLPVGTDGQFDIPIDQVGPSGSSGLTTRGGEGYIPWTLLALVVFAAGVAVALRMGWQASVSGLPYPQQVWEKTVRLASLAGYPPEPGQTPREYAQRLQTRFRRVEGVQGIAEAYNRSRFAGRDIAGEERETLTDTWNRLRRPLVGAILGRVLRRGK